MPVTKQLEDYAKNPLTRVANTPSEIENRPNNFGKPSTR